jgi:hypothetical protein
LKLQRAWFLKKRNFSSLWATPTPEQAEGKMPPAPAFYSFV